MNKNIIAIGLSSLLLAACGGGGGGNTAIVPVVTTTKVSGKAIDGYLVGATAFLDKNFNNILDIGEPSVITTANGNFILELSNSDATCKYDAPIVVNVPIGAIDETEGEVTKAYQMVIPPASITLFSENQENNITPLTTLLWKTIEYQLNEDGEKLSCERMTADVDLRVNIAALLSNAAREIAITYNIEPAKLLSDYVADDNQLLYQGARRLVGGLQKAAELNKLLTTKYPDAEDTLAIVEFEDGRWFANEYVKGKNYKLSTLSELDDQLAVIKLWSDERTTIEHNEQQDNQLEGQFSTRFIISKTSDGQEFPYCEQKESIKFINDSTKYGIENSSYILATNGELNAADCAKLGANPVEKRIVSTEVISNASSIYNRWTYNDSISVFPAEFDALINQKGKLANIDASNDGPILSALKEYPIDFYDTDLKQADYMLRTLDGNVAGKYTQNYYNERGNWYKKINNESGTYTAFCGTSKDNLTPTRLSLNDCFAQ